MKKNIQNYFNSSSFSLVNSVILRRFASEIQFLKYLKRNISENLKEIKIEKELLLVKKLCKNNNNDSKILEKINRNELKALELLQKYKKLSKEDNKKENKKLKSLLIKEKAFFVKQSKICSKNITIKESKKPDYITKWKFLNLKMLLFLVIFLSILIFLKLIFMI